MGQRPPTPFPAAPVTYRRTCCDTCLCPGSLLLSLPPIQNILQAPWTRYHTSASREETDPPRPVWWLCLPTPHPTPRWSAGSHPAPRGLIWALVQTSPVQLEPTTRSWGHPLGRRGLLHVLPSPLHCASLLSLAYWCSRQSATHSWVSPNVSSPGIRAPSPRHHQSPFIIWPVREWGWGQTYVLMSSWNLTASQTDM